MHRPEDILAAFTFSRRIIRTSPERIADQIKCWSGDLEIAIQSFGGGFAGGNDDLYTDLLGYRASLAVMGRKLQAAE